MLCRECKSEKFSIVSPLEPIHCFFLQIFSMSTCVQFFFFLHVQCTYYCLLAIFVILEMWWLNRNYVIFCRKKAFELLKQQKWLCNNCGGLIHSKYAHTLRYCYYFGKYCCPSCHNNKTHVIPAHIVKKWDFKE